MLETSFGRTIELLAALAFATSAFAQTCDVVILDGRVMDPETNFDRVGNVGVSAGWITRMQTLSQLSYWSALHLGEAGVQG